MLPCNRKPSDRDQSAFFRSLICTGTRRNSAACGTQRARAMTSLCLSGRRSQRASLPLPATQENESSLNLRRRTVNLRRPEWARNEGSVGPKRFDDTRCTRCKRRIMPDTHQPSEGDQIVFFRSLNCTCARWNSAACGTNPLPATHPCQATRENSQVVRLIHRS